MATIVVIHRKRRCCHRRPWCHRSSDAAMAAISGRRRWAVPQVIRPLLPPRLHRITSCKIIQAHCRPRHMEVSIVEQRHIMCSLISFTSLLCRSQIEATRLQQSCALWSSVELVVGGAAQQQRQLLHEQQPTQLVESAVWSTTHAHGLSQIIAWHATRWYADARWPQDVHKFQAPAATASALRQSWQQQQQQQFNIRLQCVSSSQRCHQVVVVVERQQQQQNVS